MNVVGKNTEPLISVIMAAYNCERYVDQAIDSILSQSHKNLELLIIDDCSTDNTWLRIKKHTDERINATKNPTNLGYLKTTNKLFEACNGEYIAFQDADDWSLPVRLQLQVELLTEKPDLDFCGTSCTKFFDDGFRVNVKYPKSDLALRSALSLGVTSLFCGSSIVIKSTALRSLGYYREFFDRIGAEDIDWYLRGLELGKAENTQKHLYHYRQHSSSISVTRSKGIAKHGIDIAYALHRQRTFSGTDSIDSTRNLREELEQILGNNTKTESLKKSRSRFQKALTIASTLTVTKIIVGLNRIMKSKKLLGILEQL